ncbi:MAG: hypothetical protein PHV30_05470 [Candidatus Margulisbacteria bacterium]|nr:hypothetical protein [Candidatus Margulisiibacteriota bacterium]
MFNKIISQVENIFARLNYGDTVFIDLQDIQSFGVKSADILRNLENSLYDFKGLILGKTNYDDTIGNQVEPLIDKVQYLKRYIADQIDNIISDDFNKVMIDQLGHKERLDKALEAEKTIYNQTDYMKMGVEARFVFSLQQLTSELKISESLQGIIDREFRYSNEKKAGFPEAIKQRQEILEEFNNALNELIRKIIIRRS